MKSVRSVLIIAAAGLALAVGLAFAQSEGGHAGMHRGMAGHMMGGPEFGMFLHQLNLTDDQKAQVKQIFQTEKPNIKPLMQQEFQARQQMMQLIASVKFDSKQAQTVASNEAAIHMQIEVEHAKIGSQIYQLLTSDQKAKVAGIMSKHQQMMQEHLQKQGQGAPSEQQ